MGGGEGGNLDVLDEEEVHHDVEEYERGNKNEVETPPDGVKADRVDPLVGAERGVLDPEL